MEYITLNNDVKMPILGLGTFLLEPDDAQAAVEYALSCGYELIDTANAYVNEKAVGRGMKASGKPREKRSSWRRSCGRASMRAIPPLTRHLHVSTLTTSI